MDSHQPSKDEMDKLSEKLGEILNITKVNSEELKKYSIEIKKNRGEIEFIKNHKKMDKNQEIGLINK